MTDAKNVDINLWFIINWVCDLYWRQSKFSTSIHSDGTMLHYFIKEITHFEQITPKHIQTQSKYEHVVIRKYIIY